MKTDHLRPPVSGCEDPIEERYSEEFNENRIDRLEIVYRFGDHDASKPVRTHD
ncbi:MAG: hypothetical protein ACM3MD_12080 [Betaproteobacteria bacterium]